jgi:hypothetical protein
MGRTRLARRAGVIAGAVAVMVLAACDTQPATNVTAMTATLNGKGACAQGTSGNWWYQLRPAGGTFRDVGPAHAYACTANTGEFAFEPFTVDGLKPNTTYQFRLRATVNGTSYTFDAAGTKNGTSFDSFRTRDAGSAHEDQDAPPGDEPVSCTPDVPDDPCSAGDPIKKKKNPLRNRLLWVFCDGCPFGLEGNVSDHLSWINWSYNLRTKNIRSIFHKDAQARCLSTVGYCNVEYTKWQPGDCDRSGPDTCLLRNEAQVRVNFVVKGFAWTRDLFSCLGTRIRWDGSHVRNAFEGVCPYPTVARAAARTSADVSDQRLSIGEVPVGRYLTRGELDALDGACISRTADVRECRRVGLSLYRGLPNKVRAKIENRRSRS